MTAVSMVEFTVFLWLKLTMAEITDLLGLSKLCKRFPHPVISVHTVHICVIIATDWSVSDDR